MNKGVRCPNCNKMIAEQLTGILKFKCPRCKERHIVIKQDEISEFDKKK